MFTERSFGPIRCIPGDNKGRYPHCHSIYIEDAGVIIDPASNRKRLSEIREQNAINMVWLSHWHEDHLMHLDLFDDLPLWMHKEDATPLTNFDTFIDWYGYGENHKTSFVRT